MTDKVLKEVHIRQVDGGYIIQVITNTFDENGVHTNHNADDAVGENANKVLDIAGRHLAPEPKK